MVNERVYEYLYEAGIKLYYPHRLRNRMLSITVLDFYLCDESIEDSKISNNEWFCVCRADTFYFNAIEELKEDIHYIDSYSIGNVEDKLVCLRIKGAREDALKALMYNEFSYMYPKEDLIKNKELFLEVIPGTTKLVPNELWGVLAHTTTQFEKLIKRFGLNSEDDDELIKELRGKEYAEKINIENCIFNSKKYENK